jgi:toxin CcdB
MGQFSIHENPNPASVKAYPFMIDVQSPLLEGLETRSVIPLARKADFADTPIAGLNPLVNIRSDDYLVLTQQMTVVRVGTLGPIVSDCASKRHDILSAIDLLITGL